MGACVCTRSSSTHLPRVVVEGAYKTKYSWRREEEDIGQSPGLSRELAIFQSDVTIRSNE